jgi:drug/metabolite transporter (DMT)-like permease
MITALFEIGFSLVIVGVLATLVEGPVSLPASRDALFAVVWLGIFGSGLAFLIFFRILGRWGATRASLVAYLMPVVGLLLGVLVLHEPLDARLVIGTALVVGGIALVNRRRDPSPLPLAQVAQDPG